MRRLDKSAVSQFAEGLHQLLAGVHDDGTVPRHRLINRGTRNQQKPHAFCAGLQADLIPISKADQSAIALKIADVDLLASHFFLKQHARGFRRIDKGQTHGSAEIGRAHV